RSCWPTWPPTSCTRSSTRGPGRRPDMTRLLRSPKILIGLGLSVAFGILAIAGPLLAPYNPNTSMSTTLSTPMPPSAAHWLGTTQVQQDVFSQLLVGGRSTILVSLVAG